MRLAVVACVVLVLSAGCAAPPQNVYEPPAFDVPAPPPEPLEPLEFIEPPKGVPQIEITGFVTDSEGRPVPGTLLWIEGADLRLRQDTTDAYLERRAETLVRTTADGQYRFVLDEGFYFITADAPGYRLHRSQPDVQSAATVHDIVLRPEGPTLVGHRGAHYYAPENTHASMLKSKWLGLDSVELDVRITSDDVLIIMHDRELLRTTGHPGVVHETPYAEIRDLDAGAWFHADYAGQKVPTLDDAFAWAQDLDLDLVLDVKAPVDNETAKLATWSETLDAIEQWGFEERAVFASFSVKAVEFCHRHGNVLCGWMANDVTKQRTVVEEASTMGADILMLRLTMPDHLLVAQAHGAGITLHAWALNHEADWRRMRDISLPWWGTDCPGYILDFLNGT